MLHHHQISAFIFLALLWQSGNKWADKKPVEIFAITLDEKTVIQTRENGELHQYDPWIFRTNMYPDADRITLRVDGKRIVVISYTRKFDAQ